MRTLLPAIAVVAGCIVLPLLLSGQTYFTGLLTYAAVLALFSLSINLTFGYLGFLSFGHAAFLGLGAYTAGLLTTHFGINLWVAALLAPIPAAALGVFVGLSTARLGGAYFSIATLTTAEILRLVAMNWVDLTRGPLGIVVPRPNIPFIEQFGWHFSQYYLTICALTLALVIVLVRRLLRSPEGRAWETIKASKDLAQSLGMPAAHHRVVNIAVSGAIAGLAGALLIPRILVLSPELFSITFSATGLLVVILGGSATLIGPILGGLVFAILPEMLRSVDEYRMAIFALILLVVVRARPGGLASLIPAKLMSRGRSDAMPAASAPRDSRPPAGLEVKNLTKSFGGIKAVTDVSFSIAPDELVGIIGPNGAGKTTCLSLISGFLQPTSGKIVFAGQDLANVSSSAAAGLGLVRTFQHTTITPTATAFENVLAATYLHRRQGILSALLRLPSFGRAEREQEAWAAECLTRVGLVSRSGVEAGSMPYGEQKLLSIAAALAARPRLLMLDEPAAGLNHTEANRLAGLLRSLRHGGLTIVMVDHNLRMMMALCDRIIVLDQGRLIAQGSPSEVRSNPDVVRAYLGESAKKADDHAHA